MAVEEVVESPWTAEENRTWEEPNLLGAASCIQRDQAWIAASTLLGRFSANDATVGQTQTRGQGEGRRTGANRSWQEEWMMSQEAKREDNRTCRRLHPEP